MIGLALFAVVAGGMLSWFASTHPDGLEWAMKGVSGKEELEAPKAGVHGAMAWIQEKLAFLPDYDFKKPEEEKGESRKRNGRKEEEKAGPTSTPGNPWPAFWGPP